MSKLLFHSPSGGNGATTIVANTGVALARAGHTVLIEEHSGNSLARHFSYWKPVINSETPASFHRVSKRCLENQLFMADSVTRPLTGAVNDKGPLSHSVSGTVNSDAFVLTDSTDIKLSDLEALNQYDHLVLVVSPEADSFNELASVLELMSTCERSDIHYVPLVLVNKYNPESRISQDLLYLLQTSLEQMLYREPLMTDECVIESLARGIPLVEHAPYSPVAQSLTNFAQYLKDRSKDVHAAA